MTCALTSRRRIGQAYHAQRQEILEAFVPLACTKGYGSVSAPSLAEQVGIKTYSLYQQFPKGLDQVVTEAFRWHFYRFATAVLDAIDSATDLQSYWDGLIRVHVQHQLTSPENDLWDILRATDRIAGFLPAETLIEYYESCGLYERLYAAAAHELGYGYGDVVSLVQVLLKVLDTTNDWCHWNGTEAGLQSCVYQATAIGHALMTVDLSTQGPPVSQQGKIAPLRHSLAQGT